MFISASRLLLLTALPHIHVLPLFSINALTKTTLPANIPGLSKVWYQVFSEYIAKNNYREAKKIKKETMKHNRRLLHSFCYQKMRAINTNQGYNTQL